MDFLKILRSLEELVYEIAIWLLLYPRTLWRAARHPVATAAGTAAELGRPLEHRFADQVSPVLFLLLSMLLAQAVGAALRVGPAQNDLVREAPVLSSPQNLLLFRALLFAVYPIVLARGVLRRRGVRVDRESLRAPFFSYCYLTTPFVLAGLLALDLAPLRWVAARASAVLLAGLALAWYLSALTSVLAKDLALPRARAARTALWLVASATALLLITLVAVALALRAAAPAAPRRGLGSVRELSAERLRRVDRPRPLERRDAPARVALAQQRQHAGGVLRAVGEADAPARLLR